MTMNNSFRQTGLRQNGNFHYLIAIAFLIAIVLRLGAAFYLKDNLEGEHQKRVFDQKSYNALAVSLLAGKGYSFTQDWYPFTPANAPTAHWSFLYPLYLAGVYLVFGIHPLAARIVQVVVSGLISLWLTYRLGNQLAGKSAGLIAAGLAAVYAYFVFYDASLMTESFYTLGVLATFTIVLDINSDRRSDLIGRTNGVKKPASLKLFILLGIVLGVTALLRQTILLWLPFLITWVYFMGKGKFRWWQPLVSIAIVTAFIFPWTIRNYAVYHAILPLNSNAGYALYSANHPDHGIYFDQDYAAPLPDDLVSKGLNEAQWNTALTIRGLQFITQDFSRYLLLSLSRIPIFFNFWFSSESDLASNLMRVLSFGLYLPFFIYGLILSLKQWRKFSLIYLFVIVYSAMHIFTWASIRYRLPVDAVMMPFAALALTDLYARFHHILDFDAKVLKRLSSISHK